VKAGRGREGRRGEGMGRGGGRVAPKLKLGPTKTIFLAPALLLVLLSFS